MFNSRDLAVLFSTDEKTFCEFVSIENQTITIINRDKLSEFLHTSPEKFLASKEKFEADCENMLEFLRWYNLVDCRLLTESIKKYAKGFLEEWGINIHLYKSVRKYEIFVTLIFILKNSPIKFFY